MAADSDDPGTVLGNLPRARPGQRSAKRATASRSAAQSKRGGGTAKKRASTSSTRTARPSAPRAAKRPARASAGTSAPAPARRQPARRGPDPIGDAVRVAGKVAELGFKTAGGILRRLPRP